MVGKAKKEKRKILVTGSNGMLGVDLCEELSSEYDVIGLDIQVPRQARRLVDYINCDITERDKTIRAIVGAKPELVIHAAAWTDVDGCEGEPKKAERINVKGSENVVASASELEVPLFYLSTDFVFDGKKKALYTVGDIPNPISVYGSTKLVGEKMTIELNQYAVVRASWLFGSNGENFVDTIIKGAKENKTLKVVDDQVGNPTYTKDLSQALKKLIDFFFSGSRKTGKDFKEIFHVSNRGTVSWFDYAKEILSITKINSAQLIPIKSDKLDRPAKRPAFSGLDTSYFEEIIGYKLRTWLKALKEYIDETK